MPRLLQIAEAGHPALREKAAPINDFQDHNLQELIDDLIATVLDAGSIGIAAPQVREPYRLFIIAAHPTPIFPDTPPMTPTAVINPRILAHSGERIKIWESCLSIPAIRGRVARYRTIQVEYFGRDGQRELKELNDLTSIIFQHEFDHLDGLLYLDRIESPGDIISEKEYSKLIKAGKLQFLP